MSQIHRMNNIDSKKYLAKQIYKVSLLKGNFRLRSGVTSNFYFDKYLFSSDPEILKNICMLMSDLIPSDTEIIAGLEMGAIPIATILSQVCGKPTVFVRKKPKAYGTCKLAEGAGIYGKKLVIIEDVVTSGGQVVLSVKELRGRGAVIDTVLCVIDRRESGESGNLAEHDLNLISLFKKSDLESAGSITPS